MMGTVLDPPSKSDSIASSTHVGLDLDQSASTVASQHQTLGGFFVPASSAAGRVPGPPPAGHRAPPPRAARDRHLAASQKSNVPSSGTRRKASTIEEAIEDGVLHFSDDEDEENDGRDGGGEETKLLPTTPVTATTTTTTEGGGDRMNSLDLTTGVPPSEEEAAGDERECGDLAEDETDEGAGAHQSRPDKGGVGIGIGIGIGAHQRRPGEEIGHRSKTSLLCHDSFNSQNSIIDLFVGNDQSANRRRDEGGKDESQEGSSDFFLFAQDSFLVGSRKSRGNDATDPLEGNDRERNPELSTSTGAGKGPAADEGRLDDDKGGAESTERLADAPPRGGGKRPYPSDLGKWSSRLEGVAEERTEDGKGDAGIPIFIQQMNESANSFNHSGSTVQSDGVSEITDMFDGASVGPMPSKRSMSLKSFRLPSLGGGRGKNRSAQSQVTKDFLGDEDSIGAPKSWHRHAGVRGFEDNQISKGATSCEENGADDNFAHPLHVSSRSLMSGRTTTMQPRAVGESSDDSVMSKVSRSSFRFASSNKKVGAHNALSLKETINDNASSSFRIKAYPKRRRSFNKPPNFRSQRGSTNNNNKAVSSRRMLWSIADDFDDDSSAGSSSSFEDTLDPVERWMKQCDDENLALVKEAQELCRTVAQSLENLGVDTPFCNVNAIVPAFPDLHLNLRLQLRYAGGLKAKTSVAVEDDEKEEAGQFASAAVPSGDEGVPIKEQQESDEDFYFPPPDASQSHFPPLERSPPLETAADGPNSTERDDEASLRSSVSNTVLIEEDMITRDDDDICDGEAKTSYDEYGSALEKKDVRERRRGGKSESHAGPLVNPPELKDWEAVAKYLAGQLAAIKSGELNVDASILPQMIRIKPDGKGESISRPKMGEKGLAEGMSAEYHRPELFLANFLYFQSDCNDCSSMFRPTSLCHGTGLSSGLKYIDPEFMSVFSVLGTYFVSAFNPEDLAKNKAGARRLRRGKKSNEFSDNDKKDASSVPLDSDDGALLEDFQSLQSSCDLLSIRSLSSETLDTHALHIDDEEEKSRLEVLFPHQITTNNDEAGGAFFTPGACVGAASNKGSGKDTCGFKNNGQDGNDSIENAGLVVDFGRERTSGSPELKTHSQNEIDLGSSCTSGDEKDAVGEEDGSDAIKVAKRQWFKGKHAKPSQSATDEDRTENSADKTQRRGSWFQGQNLLRKQSSTEEDSSDPPATSVDDCLNSSSQDSKPSAPAKNWFQGVRRRSMEMAGANSGTHSDGGHVKARRRSFFGNGESKAASTSCETGSDESNMQKGISSSTSGAEENNFDQEQRQLSAGRRKWGLSVRNLDSSKTLNESNCELAESNSSDASSGRADNPCLETSDNNIFDGQSVKSRTSKLNLSEFIPDQDIDAGSKLLFSEGMHSGHYFTDDESCMDDYSALTGSSHGNSCNWAQGSLFHSINGKD